MNHAADFEQRWFSGRALYGDDVGPVDIELPSVMAPGGVLLLREPTTTLGDLRQPRATRSRHRYHRRSLASRFVPASRFVLAVRPRNPGAVA